MHLFRFASELFWRRGPSKIGLWANSRYSLDRWRTCMRRACDASLTVQQSCHCKVIRPPSVSDSERTVVQPRRSDVLSRHARKLLSCTGSRIRGTRRPETKEKRLSSLTDSALAGVTLGCQRLGPATWQERAGCGLQQSHRAAVVQLSCSCKIGSSRLVSTVLTIPRIHAKRLRITNFD